MLLCLFLSVCVQAKGSNGGQLTHISHQRERWGKIRERKDRNVRIVCGGRREWRTRRDREDGGGLWSAFKAGYQFVKVCLIVASDWSKRFELRLGING